MMTGTASSSCGACKFLRRKCTSECVFVPYFSYDEAASHFAAVHKVFGASNVSKLLMHIPVHRRTEAAFTISYEAMARMTDPVFGCVSHIYNLHQQIAKLQEEIDVLGNQMAAGRGYSAFPYPVSQPQPTTGSPPEEGFNEMGIEQVTQISTMNAFVGYHNVVEDQNQSYVTDQLFHVPCMEIMNEGLIGRRDADRVFCPLFDDSDSLLSYQSVQQQQHWGGDQALFQM